MTTTRDRLLDAATELFSREGVHIGVEALCRTAGVSKRSMYQLFGSKDEVLAAGLERRAPEYASALLPGPQDTGTLPASASSTSSSGWRSSRRSPTSTAAPICPCWSS